MRDAVVFMGGPPPDPLVPAWDDAAMGDTVVIAADSGVHHAVALGVTVDVLIGDLDSADPAVVEQVRAAGSRVEPHPRDKDATDLELALHAALDRGAQRITVLGGFGGRVDHQLAALLLLGSAAFADTLIDARIAGARVAVLHGGRVSARRELVPGSGVTLTLLALHGPAEGVRASGVRFPLDAEALMAGSTRGVSNVIDADVAVVSLERGTLLAVQTEED